MSITKENFDLSIYRCRRLLLVYDIVCNQGQTNPETIIMINGEAGLHPLEDDEFNHEYSADILRASVVTAVSGLDRYMHDLVTDKCWQLLNKDQEEIPNKLAEITISVATAAEIIESVRGATAARAGERVKVAIMNIIHKTPFQGSEQIGQCMAMLGIRDFWNNVSRTMPGCPSVDVIKERLNGIVRRRNQITHEADMILKVRKRRSKKIANPLKYAVNSISREETEADIDFIGAFVNAVDKIV